MEYEYELCYSEIDSIVLYPRASSSRRRIEAGCECGCRWGIDSGGTNSYLMPILPCFLWASLSLFGIPRHQGSTIHYMQIGVHQ